MPTPFIYTNPPEHPPPPHHPIFPCKSDMQDANTAAFLSAAAVAAQLVLDR